jgi:hypothetical protein
MTVQWVVEELIATVPRDAQAEAIAQLFDAGSDLSQKWRVLRAFGTWPDSQESPGERGATLDQASTAELERRLCDVIRASEPRSLAGEPNLRSLLSVLHHEGDKEATRAFLAEATNDDRLCLAIAAACIRRIRSSAPPLSSDEPENAAIREFLGDDESVWKRAMAIRDSGIPLTESENEAVDVLLGPRLETHG